MPRAPRRFDLILCGSTGFTGRLVAEYLVRRCAGTSLRWALAGRSVERLAAIRAGLAAIDPAVAELPLLEADAMDRAAMDRLAAEATAVCTTVGPYSRYGAALVDACAAAGTHYADLTGEVPFVRGSIDRNHERAAATGARIVHGCGFDSIPSDLGVWSLQRELVARVGGAARAVAARFQMRGGPSGGTIASMFELLDAAARDRAIRRLLADPYGLDPIGSPRGTDRDVVGPGYDRDFGGFTAPFVMAAFNTRVVRRSHALLGHPWGTDWSYDERVGLARSPGGLFGAVAIAGGIGGFLAAAQVPWLRRAIERRLPSPGEGPSEEQRQRGSWSVKVRGEHAGQTLVVTFGDRLDPGYAGTAKMLGEAALCLATDELASAGGVLTPAVAMGGTLLDRLRAAGVTWEVHAA